MSDLVIVLAGWLVVWAMGALLLRNLATAEASSTPAPGEAAWTLGAGYLAGAFLVTVWMRAVSAAGITLGVASVFLPCVLAALGLAWLAVRRGRLSPRALPKQLMAAVALRDLPAWQRRAGLALVAWLALRYALMLADVALQPLYPWDAWVQWATKAKVWFELRHLVPFVGIEQWLAAGGAYYTDASPAYPATVPLWQVYSSLLMGHWNDAQMNLPWWTLSLALTLAVFGALRRLDFGVMASLAGATLVATLPLANVHVSLAGYADLPMAAYFTVAALALLHAARTRARADIAVALLFAVACPTIKNPGLVWLLTLVAPLVMLLAPRRGLRIVGAGLALAFVAVLVLAQSSVKIGGYTFHLDFAPPWNGLFESLFMLGNWNILWYAVFACALVGARQSLAPRVVPMTVLVATGAAFLMFVFAFTNAREWVDTQTTVNRAILHLVPLVVVWLMLLFREWTEARERARPREDEAAVPPPPSTPPGPAPA